MDSLGFDLSVTEELAEEEVEGLSLLPCEDVVRPVVVVVDVAGSALYGAWGGEERGC